METGFFFQAQTMAVTSFRVFNTFKLKQGHQNSGSCLHGVTALISCRLLKDWPPENPDPSTVASASEVAHQWKCHQCLHTWTVRPNARDVNGSNCPSCWTKVKGRVRQPLLVQTNPELAAEWVEHANSRTIDTITVGSGYIATWQCPLCHGLFKSMVANKVRGCGCSNLSCKSIRRLSPETLQKRKERDSQRGVQHAHTRTL